MRKNYIFWLPTLIWAGIIFAFSNHSVIRTSEFFFADFILKKTAHFTEYLILFVLVYRSFKNTIIPGKNKCLYLSLILTVLYAISDEIHQTFVPGREGRPRDVFIDSLGIVTAFYLINNWLANSPRLIQRLAQKLHISD